MMRFVDMQFKDMIALPVLLENIDRPYASIGDPLDARIASLAPTPVVAAWLVRVVARLERTVRQAAPNGQDELEPEPLAA